MRKTILATLAGLAIASSASAADLAVKAKPSFTAYPTSSGCYWGVNAEAGVARSNVSGNALFVSSFASGSLTASGGSIGGTVGCLKGDVSNWIAIQGSINYTNITGSVPLLDGSAGVQSRWSAEQVVKWGGFPAIFSWLPNLGVNFPVLTTPPVNPPPGFLFGGAKPYVMAGVREFDNSGWVGLQTGHSIGVAPMLGTGVINTLTDGAGKASGAVMDVYAKVVFAGRGFSIENIGANPNLGAAANVGTQYIAGVAVYY